MNYVDEYFEWLYTLVYDDYKQGCRFRKLFSLLFDTEFTYDNLMDENRADDGVTLRSRFLYRTGRPHSDLYLLDLGTCSMLEMLVALALRCEETIMDDPKYGDRTGYWFWGMLDNLGLNGQWNTAFDLEYCRECIDIFLTKRYGPNGERGLFYIPDPPRDVRDVEIWVQLCWYLDSLM